MAELKLTELPVAHAQTTEHQTPEYPAVDPAPPGRAAPPTVARTVRWQPGRSRATETWPVPSLLTALRRGLLCRCPACGRTALFRGYLRVVDSCAECAAPLGQARADDAPPYFTIFVVGHIVVLAMVMTDNRWQYSMWVSAAIWLPMTAVLSLLLLRPIKGATVGLMLKLGLMKSSGD